MIIQIAVCAVGIASAVVIILLCLWVLRNHKRHVIRRKHREDEEMTQTATLTLDGGIRGAAL